MSSPASMKRVLALRHFEEGREEAELGKQRRSREVCFEALQASEMRNVAASQQLHAALESGDRSEALSAEMVLACGPMERRLLAQRLTQLDAAVAIATVAWQASRLRRRQVESLLSGAEANRRREQSLREQKALDGWFLLSRPSSSSNALHRADKSLQREISIVPGNDGNELAVSERE